MAGFALSAAFLPLLFLVLVALGVGLRPALLPAATFILFVAVPLNTLPLPAPIRIFTPLSVLLIIALARGPRAPISKGTTAWFGVLFSTYAAVLGLISKDASSMHAMGSALAFIVMIVVFPVGFNDTTAVGPTSTAISWTGGVLGLLALYEARTEQSIYNSLFAARSDGPLQIWDQYRVLTTLGHPLLVSMVLAVCATVTTGLLMERITLARLALLGLTAAGLLLTASRSGAIAAGAGAGLCLFLAALGRTQKHGKGRRILLAIAVTGVLAVVVPTSALALRNASAEGIGSSGLRSSYPSLLPEMLAYTNYLGAGASESDRVYKVVSGLPYPLESSVVMFIVNFGVFGTLLGVALLASIVVPALRRGARVFPSAFVAYGIAAAGFNLLDGNPTALVVPAILLAMCAVEARTTPAAEAPVEEAPPKPVKLPAAYSHMRRA